MKKLNLFTLLCALFVCLASCEEEPVAMAPEISVGQSVVTLDADGTMVSVAYRVNNEVEGESISVAYDAEWLTVNSDKARIIEFSATSNETKETRSADVVLSYKGAESVTIAVTQQPYESPLTLKVSDVSATGVTLTVSTLSDDFTWIAMVARKAYFDSIGSDDELFNEDLEYFKYLADIYEVSLEEYLTEMLATGSMENVTLGGLNPTTEYVVYAYGLTASGKRTSEILSEAFTTNEPYEGDITFEFAVEENDFVLEWSIKPSETGVNYFYGMQKESTILEWKKTYETDDLRTAIQKGDIEAGIQKYIDYGFIEERADYYWMYNEYDIMDWGWEEVKASTKYIFYAAKWDEDCNIIGEVSTFEHTTKDVGASDNVIALTVSDVTQSSAVLSATTTNDDPYTMIPVKSSEIAGMTDEEIFTYIVGAYDYLLKEYEFEGDMTRTFQKMRPETAYTAIAFGYVGGVQTTDMVKVDFTTLLTGDPKECTFEFEVEPDTDCAWVQVTPSDKGHFYYWMVYPAFYTVDDAKSYINLLIEDRYENDFAAFASWNLSQGDDSATAWDLYSETEYKVGAIIMDYDTGEFLSEMAFSDTFKTLAVTYADISFNVTLGKYYDLQALIAAGHTEYKPCLEDGNAIMNVTVVPVGEYEEFYYDIYGNDLSDTETYPDETFYAALWYGVDNKESATFVVTYDKPQTLVAIGYDSNGDESLLYREVFTPTFENASPIEEMTTSAVKATKEATFTMAPGRIDRQQSIRESELDARKASVKAQIETDRKAALKKKVDSIKERKGPKVIEQKKLIRTQSR